MLSLGIGLGAWWAYTVLSWGGYWGWDPVENTSLIPWLTATALLHSMNLYRKRGIFKHWTVALAGGTFWLTILATWTTRTGLVTSVHAFERNTTMIWILTGLLITVAAVTIGLLAWRWRTLESELPLESLASRDFLYYATNVTLSVFAAALVFATVVVPLIGDGRSIAAHTYDLFARPLGVVVLGGLALCPLLSWGRTEGRTVWKNVRWPLAAGAVALIVMIVTGAGRSSVGGMIGLTVCVVAGAAVVMFVVTTARRAAGAGGAGAGWRRALFGSRTRSAAFVAHFGMVLVVAGLIGSNVYKSEASAYIAAKPGATAAIGGYTLKYVSMRPASGPQGSSQTYALFDVYKGGKLVGTVEPHSDIYPVAGAVAQASILGGFGRDLFVVVQDPFDQSSKHLRLQLDLFPLIRFVWIGALLLVFGAGVSLWPRRQPAAVLATAAEEGGEPA